MFTIRRLLTGFGLVCGATAGVYAAGPEVKPPEAEVIPIDSHWCCKTVDPKTKSGEDCLMISGTIEVVNGCAQYLNCSSGATKQDGKVTCL